MHLGPRVFGDSTSCANVLKSQRFSLAIGFFHKAFHCLIDSLTGKGQAGGSSNGIGLLREACYPGLADVEQLVELVVDDGRHRACCGRRPPWLQRRW
jgi:hypothetical protein